MSLVVPGVTSDCASAVAARAAFERRASLPESRPAAIAHRFKAATTIDAAGKVVMPGLINTHTHAAMVMFRGLGNDLALMDWLQKYIFPAEAKTVSPEFVRAGTRLAALEMIESGAIRDGKVGRALVPALEAAGHEVEGTRDARPGYDAAIDFTQPASRVMIASTAPISISLSISSRES